MKWYWTEPNSFQDDGSLKVGAMAMTAPWAGIKGAPARVPCCRAFTWEGSW